MMRLRTIRIAINAIISSSARNKKKVKLYALRKPSEMKIYLDCAYLPSCCDTLLVIVCGMTTMMSQTGGWVHTHSKKVIHITLCDKCTMGLKRIFLNTKRDFFKQERSEVVPISKHLLKSYS